ncbi:unnamed protein product, partial [Musa acuminata subsp. burmannicoides]
WTEWTEPSSSRTTPASHRSRLDSYIVHEDGPTKPWNSNPNPSSEDHGPIEFDEKKTRSIGRRHRWGAGGAGDESWRSPLVRPADERRISCCIAEFEVLLQQKRLKCL